MRRWTALTGSNVMVLQSIMSCDWPGYIILMPHVSTQHPLTQLPDLSTQDLLGEDWVNDEDTVDDEEESEQPGKGLSMAVQIRAFCIMAWQQRWFISATP